MKTGKQFVLVVACVISLAVGVSRLPGESIHIPNASFESPQTAFVDVTIDSWQKSPKPLWYDESGGYFWAQLTGVFLNVTLQDPDYIDNCDGNQAAWLFAVPEVELYQDLAATFEVGQSYHLTVGVLGGGGNMKDGVPLEVRLYYRDANDTRVAIGTTTFTYQADKGYLKHFQDVRLDLPAVRNTDPWAGKKIGVQVLSVLTLADLDPATGKAGGYWDIDNVRLARTLPVTVDVPNASFELPKTVFVDVTIDSWQRASKPFWYDESGGYFWAQLTGVFLNVPPQDPEYIDNCDGNQAAWLFAVPEVELYQDLVATFEVGQRYQLAVGVLGGGGNMKDEVPLEIRLYYRDANDTRVTIGTTTFTYQADKSKLNHFQDVQLDLPAVRNTDLWAGQKIGVQVISALTLADLDPATGKAGGYWDIDNVRLTRTASQEDLPQKSLAGLEGSAPRD